MSINHLACKDMIQQAWSLQKTGSRVAQLRNKLRNIRRKAPDWNRTVFGRVESEIKRRIAQLQEIQSTIKTSEDVKRERSIREELEELLNREE